jgi:SOS-response transcriptional repressor LexA
MKTAPPPRWAERISAARKKLRMSQTDFAAALNVGQGNVSKWERGTNKPLPDVFVRIAGLVSGADKLFFWEAAGLRSEYFMGTAEKTMPSELVRATTQVIAESYAPIGDRSNKTAEAVLVPLLSGSAAAGNPRSISERDIDQYLPCPKYLLPKGGAIVAVKVSGDSMAPIVDDGYMVFVDISKREPDKLINKMVAASDADGVTIKWLRRDLGHYLLVPHNVSQRHPVRVLNTQAGWGIVGEVVKWIGQPKPSRT